MDYITPDITQIKFLKNYYIYIKFKNNEEKIYNMKEKLKYKFYNRLKDIEYYKKGTVRGDTIEWPEGEDIAPENLYYDSILLKEFQGELREL